MLTFYIVVGGLGFTGLVIGAGFIASACLMPGEQQVASEFKAMLDMCSRSKDSQSIGGAAGKQVGLRRRNYILYRYASYRTATHDGYLPVEVWLDCKYEVAIVQSLEGYTMNGRAVDVQGASGPGAYTVYVPQANTQATT